LNVLIALNIDAKRIENGFRTGRLRCSLKG